MAKSHQGMGSRGGGDRGWGGVWGRLSQRRPLGPCSCSTATHRVSAPCPPRGLDRALLEANSPAAHGGEKVTSLALRMSLLIKPN